MPYRNHPHKKKGERKRKGGFKYQVNKKGDASKGSACAGGKQESSTFVEGTGNLLIGIK